MVLFLISHISPIPSNAINGYQCLRSRFFLLKTLFVAFSLTSILTSRKNTKNLNTKISKLNEELSDCETNLYHYKRGLSQVEARLVEFKEHEIKFCEKIRGLERDVEVRNNKIKYLMNELEQVKKEKEGLDNKLTGFESASKELDNLLGSQRSNKNKEGLRYNDVPSPSCISLFTPKKDLSWTGLLEFVDDTVTDYSSPTPSIDASKCNTSNLQSSNFSVSEHGESSDKGKTYLNDNYAHKRMSPRAVLLKPGTTPIVSFQRKSAVKTQPRVPRVFTVTEKIPTVDSKFSTAKSTFTTDLGNKGKAVKASACWIWRPKHNTTKQGGKITGKGIIKTSKREFENVYFMKELKYNLFSVSKIYDNKNSVLFTDSECIVLGKDFKLKDDTNMLLRTPRQHNMYSIDLNNIVPHKNLTCLVAKASVDESMLWHRRLGHLNFKTMNKLVRNNLVIGLPSKCFENDHTCVVCLKENQHKASYKTKLVNSVSKPLHTLHMDLFGPTSISSLNHKWYCLVMTDDFSRFTWTFFLRTKDETSSIHRNFITDIENLKDLKVKIIRCDNGGEFKNKEINEFYTKKCIRREFSTKDVASQDVKKDVSSLRYIALPNWFHEAHMETRNSDAPDGRNADDPESSGISNPTATSKAPLAEQVEPAVSLTVETEIPTNVWILVDCPKGVRPIDTKWVLKNKKDERGIVIRNKARLVAQGYSQEEGNDYEEVFTPVARIEDIRLFLAYASFIGFIVYQMDVKSDFLYGTIDEEVYVMQPPGFQDPKFPNRVYKVEKAIEFEALMHDKFQMSDMGELTFFLGLQVLQKKDGIFLSQDKYVSDILKKFRYSDVRSANTPMDKENPWGKDGTKKDVELHLYRSMIGSLMYLTASRPYIMFDVCACARHQVTPKECHLHVVKRIFRYLKGHPKLGLWYPKESPFDLVVYSDNNYGGATQDRKSTTRGCQFLVRRLISWQCKKQTIMATSITEAEYVAAASGCEQVLWIQN
nr:putative ribonuclease H-like domain-containing protein [Tanacetum cinerariifolium]